MKNEKYTKFITTPIFKILEDCANATKGIEDKIDNYPLCEYIMQTTFLKMTGASEQKLKCILKVIAANDFEFLDTKFLNNRYGECSNLKAKKDVFKDLKNQILKLENITPCTKKNIFDNTTKAYIKKKATEDIENLFRTSIISKWNEKDYQFFKKNSANFFTEQSFCVQANNTLSFINDQLNYESIVYNHRNNCAHNLDSNRRHLPDLSKLKDKNHNYNNYFFRFALLVLLDEIFIKMYKEYNAFCEKKNFDA